MSARMVQRGLVALLGLAAVVAAPVGAQGTEPVERVHAEPSTRWARSAPTGAAVLDRGGPARVSAITGAMRQLLVPVTFSDVRAIADSTALDAAFYGDGALDRVSVPGYWESMSNGRFTVDGGVAPRVDLAGTMGTYVGSKSNSRWSFVADSLDRFLREVVGRVDSTVDLREWADEVDAQVPALVIVVAGRGGECQGPGMWAHRYTLRAVLGAPWTSAQRTADGRPIVIDDYIVISADACDAPGQLTGAGTLLHETGHLLGLPDLYSTAGSGSDNPVGVWDLMGSGNYNTLRLPAALGAWSRTVLGWATPRLVADGSTRIEHGEVVHLPFRETDEHLLLEVRRRTGTDRFLPGEGVVVWRVDPQRASAARIAENRVNTDPSRRGVSIVQADGQRDLDLGRNRGDAGDPWPGTRGSTALDSTTTPIWLDRQGRGTGGFSALSYEAATGVAWLWVGGETGEPGDDEPVGPLVLEPSEMPRGVAGAEYRVAVRVAGDPRATVRWEGDSLALRRVGLSFAVSDTTSRVAWLTGPLAEDADTTEISLTAIVEHVVQGEVRTDTLTRSWRVDIVPNPHLSMERVSVAISDPTRPLTTDQALFYDVRGNVNGRLDIGDLVIARRQGLISDAGAPAPPDASLSSSSDR